MKISFDNKIKSFIKNQIRFFEERKLLKKIKEAFLNNEFEMHIQFVVDNKSKKITSAEALSRWVTSSGEIIFPGAYISLMQKFGLINKFDYYMFEKVCQKLSEWKNTEFENLSISCNITRITISEKGFSKKIKSILEKYDFDRSKLIIEITEDTLENDFDNARQNIIEAKKHNIRIALDDIGNGYTSLVNLCEYPIDIVKIDRSVLLFTDKENGKKLYLGIISLIRSLNLKSVCEGVETEEQNDFVSKSDCDYIQGWYYCKAFSDTDAQAFYKEYMKKF